MGLIYETKTAKKWFIKCISFYFLILAAIVSTVWIVDPLFHYHKPFSFISYRLYYERYVNDGILRHFDYDTVITGTSMAQNFKTSEAEELFGGTCVKATFSGAGYGELSGNLRRALQRNDKLHTVIWTMDYNALLREADWGQYDEYPTYLYDDNPFNDVSYVFNKSIWYRNVFANMLMTLTGTPSTTMDDYSTWTKDTGHEYIMMSYDRLEVREDMAAGLDDEEKIMVAENVQKNFVDLINEYPDTTFYIFYTPYSIYFWDSLMQEGRMQMQFDEELIATELLLECPNVRLYNFSDKHEVINDAGNYRDKEHYSAEVNSKILQWIADGDGLVTKENYQERLAAEKEYYLNYDYGRIFEGDR